MPPKWHVGHTCLPFPELSVPHLLGQKLHVRACPSIRRNPLHSSNIITLTHVALDVRKVLPRKKTCKTLGKEGHRLARLSECIIQVSKVLGEQ